MKINSPVTGNDNTSLIQKIPTANIIELYQVGLQMDVTRYFTGLESIQLRRCEDAGYRFYYPFTIFGDNDFYQDLQGLDGYYSEEKWEYEIASKLIEKQLSVLEIGSGGGQFLQKLSNKKCERLCGLELNSAAVARAISKGLNVIDSTIEEFSKENPGSFDVVCALQVLEHISDIHSFLTASLRILKPGAKLIFCVPNNNPYLYKHDFFHTLNLPPHHAGLWNKEAFSRLPDFFPVRLNSVHIEPLTDYKKWYIAQIDLLQNEQQPAIPLDVH